MDPAHRDILRRHWRVIVSDLNVDRVKDMLNVTSPGHWEDISMAGRETRLEKASRLMDSLPTRGPNAFWHFCETLMTGGYEFLGKLLIDDARQILADRTVNIREDYRKMMKHRNFALLRALNKVALSTKRGGRKASEQKITKLKYIKEARERISFKRESSPELDIFAESELLALDETLDLVKKLKHIKDELERDGSFPEYVSRLNSVLAEGADISTLYDDVKDGIGSHYLKSFSLQSLDPSDLEQFGSVLVLIPFACDISEEAVKRASKVPRTPTPDDEEHERPYDGGENAQEVHLITSKVDILAEEMRKLHGNVDKKFDQMGRQIQHVAGKVDDLDTKVNDIQASLQADSRQHLSRPPKAGAERNPGSTSASFPPIGRGQGQPLVKDSQAPRGAIPKRKK